jgi:hypothetical protein
MTTRGKTRRRPLRPVAVGRDFEMTKPRFYETFIGQITMIVIAGALIQLIGLGIQSLEGRQEPDQPPIECVGHTQDINPPK